MQQAKNERRVASLAAFEAAAPGGRDGAGVSIEGESKAAEDWMKRKIIVVACLLFCDLVCVVWHVAR
mgnify:CR=1 FL=1